MAHMLRGSAACGLLPPKLLSRKLRPAECNWPFAELLRHTHHTRQSQDTESSCPHSQAPEASGWQCQEPGSRPLNTCYCAKFPAFKGANNTSLEKHLYFKMLWFFMFFTCKVGADLVKCWGFPVAPALLNQKELSEQNC